MGRSLNSVRTIAVIVFSLLAVTASFAGQISMSSDYLATTTKIDIPAPPGLGLLWTNSISDPLLTVNFNQPMAALSNWNNWGTVPSVESSNPAVLWNGQSFLNPQVYGNTVGMTFTLAGSVTTFGFEALPDDLGTHTITVDYYSGSTLLGSIAHSFVAGGSAYLFAWQTDAGPITAVNVSSNEGFGMANIRYIDPPLEGALPEVPEPASMVLLGSGLSALALRIRKWSKS